MNKFYIFLIILIIFGGGLIFIFRAGWHPVALVNSQLIWDWALEKEHASALVYYGNAVQTYEDIDPAKKQEQLELIQGDLRRAVLDKIIEKIIISNGARQLIGDNKDLLVKNKIEKYLENTKLTAAAKELFNLDPNDFRNIVLVPQAEKELVEEQLISEGRDFDNWLLQQKKQARVYLFTKEFSWSETVIESI